MDKDNSLNEEHIIGAEINSGIEERTREEFVSVYPSQNAISFSALAVENALLGIGQKIKFAQCIIAGVKYIAYYKAFSGERGYYTLKNNSGSSLKINSKSLVKLIIETYNIDFNESFRVNVIRKQNAPLIVNGREIKDYFILFKL
jgi:hypothetical protein